MNKSDMKLKRCAFLLVAVLLICVYMKYDGLYVIGKAFRTDLEMINKYASYQTNFPDDTIIEEYSLNPDYHSWFFSHNEYIEATLLVPTAEMEKMIPAEMRQYNYDIIKDWSDKKVNDLNLVQYCVWMPRRVEKWIERTDRQIYYTVMKLEGEYTRVYLLVDKLGWNLLKYD